MDGHISKRSTAKLLFSIQDAKVNKFCHTNSTQDNSAANECNPARISIGNFFVQRVVSLIVELSTKDKKIVNISKSIKTPVWALA